MCGFRTAEAGKASPILWALPAATLAGFLRVRPVRVRGDAPGPRTQRMQKRRGGYAFRIAGKSRVRHDKAATSLRIRTPIDATGPRTVFRARLAQNLSECHHRTSPDPELTMSGNPEGISVSESKIRFADESPLVWYVSYGSNLRLARLKCYLQGGTPPGGRLEHPGARDTRLPRDVRPLELTGGLYFAGESIVWTGGIAFYDPELPATTPGRAYLITEQQLSDIISQELHFAGGPPVIGVPDRDYDFRPALAGGWHPIGPGPYETIVHVGHLDDHPVFTLSGPHRASEATHTAPSAQYLAMLVEGFAEAHGWPKTASAEYLCSLPGARGVWTPDQVATIGDHQGVS